MKDIVCSKELFERERRSSNLGPNTRVELRNRQCFVGGDRRGRDREREEAADVPCDAGQKANHDGIEIVDALRKGSVCRAAVAAAAACCSLLTAVRTDGILLCSR